MKYIIGAHNSKKNIGKSIYEIYDGIWDTIEAENANKAAIKYLFKYQDTDELFVLKDWNLYEVDKNFSIKLFTYEILQKDVDEMVTEDQSFVW